MNNKIFATKLFQGKTESNVLGLTILEGLLGVEYDFPTNELSVGMMPGASFLLGIGVEGNIKQGLKFKF